MWVFLGIAIIITFLAIILGVEKISKIFRISRDYQILRRVLLRISALIFLVGAVYGLYRIFATLPFNDKSILLIPFIVFTLYFVGASIGIYQNKV